MFTFGSLFSGIGGLELGLEWSGLGHTVWQVEQNAFCRKVLAKHWPNTERLEDVKEVGAHNLRPVDLICGGFPCQPFSTASRGRKVAEDLWPEMCRVVAECAPQWVICENVQIQPIEAAATDMENLGYSASCFCLSASMVGAPHERIRWFMVANSNGNSQSKLPVNAKAYSLQSMAGLEAWKAGPPRLGMDDGVSHRVDRLRALGNAVVPQCAEVIGHMILELSR